MEHQGSQNRPFVARDHELSRLRGFLDRAMGGSGTVCFVTGEAGSGKSALLGEFERRTQGEFPDIMFADGDCNPQTGSGDPYLPFREIMSELSGVEEEVDDRGPKAGHSRRFFQATASALAEHGPDLIDIFVPGGALVTRLGAQAAGKVRSWKKGEGQKSAGELISAGGLDQGHLFEQYTNVIREIAKQQALVLMVDDLHWADEASIGLLFHLSRRLSTEPVLIIGSYRAHDIKSGRDSERHPLESKLNELKRYHGDIWIDLEQMEQDAGRQFVDQILDAEPNDFDEEFRSALFQRTRGHALFTTELVRYLKERGYLEQNQQGAWTATAGLTWEGLPARVEGVISERTARLDPEERDLLVNASILGETFSAEILAEMLGLQVRNVVRTLSGPLSRTLGLVRAHGFERTGGRRYSVYEFQHVLIQKYFYESLDAIEQGFLHESAGEAIEELSGGQANAMAIQLARHFSEAGITDKAVGYQLLAGNHARNSHANTEALSHLGQALEMLEGAAPGEFEQGWYEPTVAEVCTSLGCVLEMSGEFELARRRFEQALELVPDTDRINRVRLHREIATTHEREHEHNTALEMLTRAAVILEEDFDANDPGEMSEWISIRNSQLWINYWQGNTDRMRELETEAEDSVIQYGSASQKRRYFSAISGLGNRLDGFLPSDESLETSKKALLAVQESNSEVDRADGFFAAGFFRMLRGETDSALEYFVESLETAKHVGDRILQARGLTYLGVLKRRAGDLAGIEEFLQPALEISESLGMQEYVAVVYANRSWVAWKNGDDALAVELASDALEAWKQRAPKYPFKWLAYLQLIAIAINKEDLALCVEHTGHMLAPPSARLAGGVDQLLAEAVSAFESGDIETARDRCTSALEAARDNGYL
jgi:tetratricopeptide (TPR) repeat protein